MGGIREFATGATRDQNANKYDFGGFTCPLVLERFAQYMHQHRKLPDGSLRAADNWKKGIPLGAYAESEWRHHLDFQKAHQGLPAPDIEDSICALIFNLQGYLHERLKAKPPAGVVDHAVAAAFLRDRAERDDDLPAHPFQDQDALTGHVTAPIGAQSGGVVDTTRSAYVPNPPSNEDGS